MYFAKFNSIPLSTYWNSSNSSNFGSAKQYVPEIPWNDACASTLIANYVAGTFTTYGATPGFCNNSLGNGTANYLSTGAGSGGASNCASRAAFFVPRGVVLWGKVSAGLGRAARDEMSSFVVRLNSPAAKPAVGFLHCCAWTFSDVETLT
ncbi:MAG TPA: hypothetical protein VII95_11455 [Terriglobales bacterium]